LRPTRNECERAKEKLGKRILDGPDELLRSTSSNSLIVKVAPAAECTDVK
jgi:hypothetical protein